MEKQKKKIIHKLKHKYRLIIFNDITYKEVWWIRLSRLNAISAIVLFLFIFLAIIITAIVYTPLKEFIPGYPDGEMNKNIVLNSIKVDSLENALRMQEQYFQNLKAIIMGEELDDYVNKSISDTLNDSTLNIGNLEHHISKDDSLLRVQIEQDGSFNLSQFALSNSVHDELSVIKFIAPLKGVITSKYNKSKRHYGIDIVAAKDELIIAALKGKVVFTGWTLETGNVVHVQHENNLLTVYKHLANIKIAQGDNVKQGEPIAIVGNTGEETTGPHLHFELWYKGESINPEEYIIF